MLDKGARWRDLCCPHPPTSAFSSTPPPPISPPQAFTTCRGWWGGCGGQWRGRARAPTWALRRTSRIFRGAPTPPTAGGRGPIPGAMEQGAIPAVWAARRSGAGEAAAGGGELRGAAGADRRGVPVGASGDGVSRVPQRGGDPVHLWGRVRWILARALGDAGSWILREGPDGLYFTMDLAYAADLYGWQMHTHTQTHAHTDARPHAHTHTHTDRHWRQLESNKVIIYVYHLSM